MTMHMTEINKEVATNMVLKMTMHTTVINKEVAPNTVLKATIHTTVTRLKTCMMMTRPKIHTTVTKLKTWMTMTRPKMVLKMATHMTVAWEEIVPKTATATWKIALKTLTWKIAMPTTAVETVIQRVTVRWRPVVERNTFCPWFVTCF